MMDSGSGTLLYSSERTRIYHLTAPDNTQIVCKEPLGSDAATRLSHERDMLARLQGIDGVPQLAGGSFPPNMLALREHGGAALAQVLQHERLTIPAMLALALGLGRILAAVHGRGVVHHDINPHNILLAGPDRNPVLIDFQLASANAELTGQLPTGRIVGTLAYVSPEQASRSGRIADHRADLYSFGATLYELAVGHPPFRHKDVLQLVRDQLTLTPAAPAELNPTVPPMLSALIMRLLEKEPDRRYQSADGLTHDLRLIVAGFGTVRQPDFVLGLRDFPPRLSAPSQLIGRESERAALLAAFEGAVQGTNRGVLLAGEPGVGKKRLVAELHPAVTARSGYFVTGKFDLQRRDRQSDGVHMAFRALGRLLMAEADEVLLALQRRLHKALGLHATIVAALAPEFAILLDLEPEHSLVSALDSPSRLVAAATALVRAVATPQRPLVIAIDDVQWASPFALALIDAMMRDADLPGLLLVIAWRDNALQPGHPLAQLLSDWTGQGVLLLSLDKFQPTQQTALLEQVLRMPSEPARTLAAALAEHTCGNPYDTIELVNALRQDGVLRLENEGWRWDPVALRRHVGLGGPIDLLHARIRRLPADSGLLLQTMACLGGDIRMEHLEAATGMACSTIDILLAPALDDGLLALSADADGSPAVRFRHDRVQQAAYGAMAPDSRAQRHLNIARRLGALPETVALAAAQYMAAQELIAPAEHTRVIEVYRQAAHLARQSNDTECERLVRAALALLGEPIGAAQRRLQTALRSERHGALVRLGHAAEADIQFTVLSSSSDAAVLDLVPVTCLQISALMLRRQPAEAVALGRHMLDQLGLPLLQLDGPEAIAAELAEFALWLQDNSDRDPHSHAEAGDARIVAVAMVLERCVRAAFFIDDLLLARLALGAWRLWREHGICPPLVAPVSFIGIVAIRQLGDYQLGYVASRFLQKLSEARGYVLEAVRARAVFAVSHSHWFEPVEDCVAHARQSYAALMQAGDLLAACFPLIAVVSGTLESASTLAASVIEANAALDIAARAHNRVAAPYFRCILAFSRSLQGDQDFLEMEDPATLTPVARANWHIAQASLGALTGDHELLAFHSHAAFDLRDSLYGNYSRVLATTLRAVSLAQQVQLGNATLDPVTLAAISGCRVELAQWASNAPANFGHLLNWLDAEHAWAGKDARRAALAFDKALAALDHRQRPWHRALITERAGRFHLAHAMRRAGSLLMSEAHRYYMGWGATAKVAQLEREYAYLKGSLAQLPLQTERRTHVSTDSLHMMALLRASQALSSETSLGRLHARVTEQLGTMTGASKVQLILPSESADDWTLACTHGLAPTIEDAARDRRLPLSVFRYIQRTRALLVVDDALTDDRFASDPYWTGLTQCSLLLMPILNRGTLRAILILENHLRRGAFAEDRLEAVELIAGQLAVSLDNAVLYASLERKVAERTAALELANQELAALSVTDALTGLANRRHFDQVLDTEWRRAARLRAAVGAAMIDIDQFKLYNDHYGHQQGDICLQMVATALADSVRKGIDFAARYGGEEFAIILPGAELVEVHSVAERARAAVAALAIPHALATHGIVTVSIGVAALALDSGDQSPAGLFARADAALYQAKYDGRNRICDAAEVGHDGPQPNA